MSPGQTLNLAPGGSYTLAGGANGFSTTPNGTATDHITINGNGATITGGLYNVSLLSKSYIDFVNIHFRDATGATVILNSCHYITFTDCDFQSVINPAAFVDLCKNRGSDHIDYTRCIVYPSLGEPSVDGFEFWDCDDCTCTDCVASGLQNGPELQNNGHGFEVYGESAAETCLNIQFIRCRAFDNRGGFSVESPNNNAAHTVFCVDCLSDTEDIFDYNCENVATLTITGYDGGTIIGDGTVIHD